MTGATIADGTVLVVGAGYVGQRFLARQPEGSSIGLSRSAIPSSRQIEIFNLDIGGELPLTLPRRYSVLYTVPPARASMSDVRLERLLAVLQPVPQRFVYISTTGVYGNRGGASVDETSPLNPETDRARKRIAAENLLHSWGSQTGCEVVILRVPGIYGPGRLGVERLHEGAPVIAEHDASPGNRIHVDDLVTCCAAALTSTTPPGVYNVGDGDHRTSTWFTNEVARQSGLPLPQTITMQQAEREFSPMRLSFLRESRRVETTRMRDVLGVSPRYANAEDGIRASLADSEP
ncbi:MAG: NAD-dependent epimerase/dehydratase family protein [Gammaproteobacteria bacterium]|nr:NAD-dependent epimerase/dehydratase family protein [Gammaproteobacteria bacterium]